MPYSHLKIHSSKKFLQKIKLGYPLGLNPFIFKYYFIIKLLSKFNVFRKISSHINEFVRYSNDNVQKTFKSIELLNKKQTFKANDYQSDYGYSEIGEIKGVLNYAEQIENNFPNPSESKQLYLSIDEIYSSIIEKYKINNFLNFGSYLSHTDSILAKKYPNTKFICADRSSYTKIINEKMFNHLNNMDFVDGDIFKYLNNKEFDNDLFFSARTLPLLPKKFIEDLYYAVCKSNFKYISFMEQIGISHQTLSAYDFSDEDKPSIAFRWGMYLHNYPGILKKCGYKVIESKLIKTDHPFEDYRFLYILAEKK